MKKRILLITILLLSGTLLLGQTAEEIMTRVFNREDGSSQIAAIRLSTCLYRIQNRRLTCSEKPRIKMMETVRKDFGKREEDSKSITLIKQPASERGIGLLQFDYDDISRDTDQWMYFSAIGRVKRIVSGDSDEPKTGSFFGSEITYEDLEQKRVADYRFQILKEEIYKGHKCWVIESIPKPQRARKSNYSKTISWVNQEYFLTMKVILYNRQGRKMKRINSSKFEVVDGIQTFRQMTINNLETRRITSMEIVSLAYNIPVDDEFLTRRTLIDSAFRERELNKYIKFLK